MKSRWRRCTTALAPALVLCSLAASCAGSETPTQIVVVIDSDWAALERVRLEIDHFGDQEPIEISLARDWLPRTVALLHEGGPMGPISVTASGFVAGQDEPAIVEPREQVFFERGRVRGLRIELLQACVGECEPGQACVDDDGPSCVDPSTLGGLSDWNGHDGVKVLRPDLKHGTPVATDAGRGRDAGMRGDAGIPDDAGVRGDAGMADDGSVPDDAGMRGDAGTDTSAGSGGKAGGGGKAGSGGTGGTGGETIDAGVCATPLNAPCGACGPVKRKLITINHAEVSAALSNFPLLVSLVDSDLQSSALANGHDLCVTDTDGDPLSFEIERWDSASGALDAWVRVPTLRVDQDTALYLYYGDDRDVDRSDPSGVWDSDYLGVYHMGGPSDSTAGNRAGTAVGVTTVAGRIGNAASFDGADGYLELGQDAFDDLFASGGTVEAWFRATTFGENELGRIFDKASGTPPTGGWTLFVRDNGQLVDQSIGFGQAFDGNKQRLWNAPDNSITLVTWHHVAVVYDSALPTNDPVIYLDGAPATISTLTLGLGTPSAADSDADSALRIGNHYAASTRTFAGLIDEVRFSNSMRSAAWFATQLRNQQSPATFLSVGAEEDIP